MKKLVLALSIMVIAFASVAIAQTDIANNNLGIYLANGDHFATTANPAEQLDLHVLVSNMTVDQLSGFEFKLETEGSIVILGTTVAYPTDAINAATRQGEYVVGFGTPVPAVDGTVEVMTFSVIVIDPAIPASLFLGPVYFPSLVGVPSYLANADTGELVECRQSTGGPDDPVFVVNTQEVPVSTDNTTFDSLKSLYR